MQAEVRRSVEREVGEIEDVTPVGGGCISNACRVKSSGGTFFLKWSSDQAGQTFEAEAAGLKALREAASPLHIPEVLAARNGSGGAEPGFILMDWIDEGPKGRDFWPALGAGLAVLHRTSDSSFGFAVDNFIGRIEQVNAPSEVWPRFFLKNRLEFQRDLARRIGGWSKAWDAGFDRLAERLPDILPDQPVPSLVHGDLWNGNVIATAAGAPTLIDPATHYAHREVDLAMSELFGGFPPSFYRAYREAWPLDAGYEERRDIYNLYHLINHLNHFGSAYAGQVQAILNRYRPR